MGLVGTDEHSHDYVPYHAPQDPPLQGSQSLSKVGTLMGQGLESSQGLRVSTLPKDWLEFTNTTPVPVPGPLQNRLGANSGLAWNLGAPLECSPPG